MPLRPHSEWSEWVARITSLHMLPLFHSLKNSMLWKTGDRCVASGLAVIILLIWNKDLYRLRVIPCCQAQLSILLLTLQLPQYPGCCEAVASYKRWGHLLRWRHISNLSLCLVQCTESPYALPRSGADREVLLPTSKVLIRRSRDDAM